VCRLILTCLFEYRRPTKDRVAPAQTSGPEGMLPTIMRGGAAGANTGATGMAGGKSFGSDADGASHSNSNSLNGTCNSEAHHRYDLYYENCPKTSSRLAQFVTFEYDLKVPWAPK